MKKTLIALFMLISFTSNAQIAGKKSKESITIFDSITVNVGDTIHLGSGSDRRGDFVYIYQPPNGFVGTPEASLPRNYANKYFVIKHFKNQKDKRSGEKKVAVINPGMLNCLADIEAGINAEEIIAINSRSFKKKTEPVAVVVKNEVSIADELTKLKKLLDDGILTKEEYESQKKKLLEKN